MDLFTEHGYEQTSVAEIADAAGVTERTFFRHFTDKREVLFSGDNLLEELIQTAIADAEDPALHPARATLAAIAAAGTVLESRRGFVRRRNAVVASNASLRERELLKLAGLADIAATALRQHGTPEQEAVMVAEVAITLFRIAFDRWVDEADTVTFAEVLDTAARQLQAMMATPTDT